jgi:polyisoprenoid-binding protein YceI
MNSHRPLGNRHRTTAGIALAFAGWLVSAGAVAQQAAERYVVDPAQSDLHWLVYKAGALARFGHNHTVAVGDLSGTVTVNRADLPKSQFELEFAVANLVVDDPALRGTLGEEFASVPSAEDIQGTRGNMLGEHVLDAEKHPRIRIVGAGPAELGGTEPLAVKVELLGRVIDLTVPTSVTIEGDELRAKGEFELDHADLGMQPFTALAGALRVGETLSFEYDVTARRAAR